MHVALCTITLPMVYYDVNILMDVSLVYTQISCRLTVKRGFRVKIGLDVVLDLIIVMVVVNEIQKGYNIDLTSGKTDLKFV